MLSVDTSFFLLVIATLVGALFGWRLYRTVLNPLTYMSVINIGFYQLMSGYACYGLLETRSYDASILSKTVLICLLYFFGVVSPYFFRRVWLVGFYGNVIKLLKLNSNQIAENFNLLTFVGLLVSMLISFFALAILGHGGLLWLTDTREAYITYRAGVGLFYAGMQWFTVAAFLYYLWVCRPKGLRLMILVLIFAVFSYFSGSKGNILNVGLVAIVYFNFYIRRILIKEYLMLILLFLLCFSGLLLIQGADLSLFMYISDYFNTTAMFLSRFNEFGYRYGGAWLEDLWFYVPRGLYPNKPYEYGVLVIHQVLFPGMAEIGNTPGFLSWTMSYLDFGLVGVYIGGFLTSVWQRAVYEYYIRHRDNLFSFVFMIHFTLFPLLLGVTTLITFILMVALSLYLRILLNSSKKSKYMIDQR